jgi:NADH dehydrogenase
LRRTRILNGRVTAVQHANRRLTFAPHVGPAAELEYDSLVMSVGSIVRTLPIPGLAEVGIGFKTVGEAIFLRNHVLAQLDIAASTEDAALRRRALTFVFVGGGYAGVEALAELEDMARDACRSYPNVSPADMRWILVEATDRILPEVSRELGAYTIAELRRRGIEVRLQTRLESAVDRHIVLSDGEEFDADTLVWTAGVRAHPLITHTDLPRDEKDRLRATASLRVEGVDDAWTAGDCAAVPDLTKPQPALCGPSAQHAVRQGKLLGDNIVASLRGRPVRDTKALRKSTASPCVAFRPGSCTARTTCPAFRPLIARCGWWLIGPWRCSSPVRLCRWERCSGPAKNSNKRPARPPRHGRRNP